MIGEANKLCTHSVYSECGCTTTTSQCCFGRGAGLSMLSCPRVQKFACIVKARVTAKLPDLNRPPSTHQGSSHSMLLLTALQEPEKSDPENVGD